MELLKSILLPSLYKGFITGYFNLYGETPLVSTFTYISKGWAYRRSSYFQ